MRTLLLFFREHPEFGTKVLVSNPPDVSIAILEIAKSNGDEWAEFIFQNKPLYLRPRLISGVQGVR